NVKIEPFTVILKNVEIGGEYINLIYGRGENVRQTRILHGAMDSCVLADIVEKFRRETGIIPEITN
ncbi:MAG: hypothetical protein K6U74_15175, partial [Firmicutes bacterium]|nr:hypothetical protein [Bacillota bacterium]